MARRLRTLEQDAPMPSRRRDPHDLAESLDNDDTTHRTPALGRSKPFPRRSTTHRLPAFDPYETFHTRATPPRMPALGEWELDEDGALPPELSEDDFWFIAGPSKPGTPRPERRKTRLTIKTLARLAMLPLAFLMLLGAQGFISTVSRECEGASARQHQQSCLALGVFTTLSGLQMVNPPPPPTPTAPPLPAVPADLPANVHGFVVLALPYTVQAHQALGWPVSVLMAQWGLEHGWSVPDAQGYNWGNTTYAPGCTYRGSNFCYAATPAEGLREYIYTARLPFYDSVRAALAQGADATAVALGRSPWDAGHYTTIGQPGSTLLEIMRNFNLYRLDRGG